MEEVAASAQFLSQMAEDLQSIIAKFKLIVGIRSIEKLLNDSFAQSNFCEGA